MKTVLIIAMVLLALAGCDGTGGVGGQGIAITAEGRARIQGVTITITDGGTDLSGMVAREIPTTQPAGTAEAGE
ncbi:MAG: hypothetical protein QGG42_13795 [Phycisphaerae bacterium]|jgi:hypothetical protein|nr:hypothetical protein [Phycisphaerae bacterium]